MITGRMFLVLISTFQLALLASATPLRPVSFNETATVRNQGYDIPLMIVQAGDTGLRRRGDVSGSMGLGDNADLLYSIPVEIGSTVFALQIDTGSSDLWVISNQCKAGSCSQPLTSARYSQTNMSVGPSISMSYGDSTTGSSANGTISKDAVAVAGIAVEAQAFAVVNSTDNPIIETGLSGIFGLGFPTGSIVQQSLAEENYGEVPSSAELVLSAFDDGPMLPRIALTDALPMPLFSITFQRNTVDAGGQGLLTLGKLPNGISVSDLTWVPVKLYKQSQGGIRSPSYARKEVFPYRWEIDIDAVFLDGERLPDSTIEPNGVDITTVSAFIDSGNSILRGPQDVVDNILTKMSSSYNPSDETSVPKIACNVPHTLAFQIGGKLFPIDPRDLISQPTPGNGNSCKVDKLVATDPPSQGALFRWSLGAPLFKSNVVAFHYGNLTHPSYDPPRIGFLNTVPTNASQLLEAAVATASDVGGSLPDITSPPPTQSAAALPKTTVTVTISPPFQALRNSVSSAKSHRSPFEHRSRCLIFLISCFVTLLF